MQVTNFQWALTLEWENAGNKETQQFYDQQPTNIPGIIRIGRDSKQCDVVLSHSTISAMHVEIYFNQQQLRFFLRNLQSRNICLVNGVSLVQNEEFPLSQGSIIHLGKENQQITVSAVSITGASSIDSTILPSSSQINKAGNANTNSSKDDKSWQETTLVPIAVALLSIAGTWYVAQMNTHTEEKKIQVGKEIEDKKIESEQKKLNLELRAKKREMDDIRFYGHQDKVREILIKTQNKYNKITLKNECSTPVKVAASFTALDGISETRGWNLIPEKEDLTPAYFTDSEVIFLYAYTIINNKTYPLQGEDYSIEKLIARDQFNYIADTFYYSGKDKPQSVNFYQVKFELKNKDASTIKTFSCDGGKLQLK